MLVTPVLEQLMRSGRVPMSWEGLWSQIAIPTNVTVQAWKCWGTKCALQDAMDGGHRAVQSTCLYLDWDNPVRSYWHTNLVPCAGASTVDPQRFLGASAALWTERVSCVVVLPGGPGGEWKIHCCALIVWCLPLSR